MNTPSKPLFLSGAELASRIEKASAPVAKEVYAATRYAYDAEMKRSSTLDARATSLVGAAALTLTVALVFGNSLVTGALHLGTDAARVVIGLYFLAVALGVATSVLALKSLLVADNHPVIDDGAIFREAVLARDKDGDEYVKTFAVHLAMVFQSLMGLNVRRATSIRRAQFCFGAFMLLVIITGGVIAMSKKPEPPTPKQQQTRNEQKPAPTKQRIEPVEPRIVKGGRDLDGVVTLDQPTRKKT